MINELIPTEKDNQGNILVSGRDLHEFLEIGKDFSNWFKDMIKYGFEEGKDFTPFLAKSHGGRPRTEYAMTLDMAKEISMIQRNEKGKQARQYFIKVEEAYKQEKQLGYSTKNVGGYQVPSNYRGALLLAADLQEQVEIMKPKAIFADSVSTSQTTILIGDLAKILKGNGINIGAKRLFQWMRDNGYLIKRKGADYNSPTQKSMNLGLFQIKESSHVNGDGVTVVTKTPKVTGKGQNYFVNKFLSENERMEA